MRRLVLVGAGHAHVGVLRRFALAPPAGVELLLVSPTCAVPSSGMVPGYLAGHYSWQDCCIDFNALCTRAGAKFMADSVIGIDADGGRLQLASGAALDYDIVSLNTGAGVAAPAPGQLALLPMRPLHLLAHRWEALRATLAALAPGSAFAVVMVGGGAAGVETILAVAHALRRAAPQVQLTFTLAMAGATLMRGSAPGAVRRLTRHLERQRIALLPNFNAEHIDGDAICAADGSRLCADAVFWSTAAQAPAWLRASTLTLDDGGFVRVDASLRSLSHRAVFAAGDCASLPAALPKAGVYAVRMGAQLGENLLAALAGAGLKSYRPQPRFLALIGTGDTHAVAAWGRWSWQGRWVWRWKRRIDEKFIASAR